MYAISSPSHRLPVYLGIILSLAISGIASGQNLDFSLTRESPKIPSEFHESDDITADGSSVQIPATDLGVLAPDYNVNGLSYGKAEAADVNTPYFIKRLSYSVDTNAMGNGVPIVPEVMTDGAAGDTFALDFVGVGTRRLVIRRPFTLVKAQTRNLTVKIDSNDPEDDIDGLALFRGQKYPLYVTFSPGSGFDPASIYTVNNQGGPPQVFAGPTDLGLTSGDVIDAFALGTAPFGGPPPTALNPNVVIWISLASGSPSRGGGGDNILQAWPAPRGTVLGWQQMNLAVTDEVNAIAVLDPFPPFPVNLQVEAALEFASADSTIWPAVGNEVPWTLIAHSKFNRWMYGETAIIGACVGPLVNGPWDPIGEAEKRSVRIGSIENVVPGAVAAGRDFLLTVTRDFTDLTTPDGGITTITQAIGTKLNHYHQGSLNHTWSQVISTSANAGAAALDILEKPSEEPVVFICGSFGNEGVDLGTMHLDTMGETGIDAYSLWANIQESGVQGTFGIQIKTFGRPGISPNEIAQSGAAIILQDSTNLCRGMVAVEILAPHVRVFPVTPEGLGDSVDFLNVNPTGGSGSIRAAALIDYEVDLEGDTVEIRHVLSLVSTSFTAPAVSAIKVTETATFVAVNSVDRFTFLGETFGENGNPQAFLFKLDMGETPQLLGVFQTDSPAGVTPQITEIDCHPITGELGVTLNTIQVGALLEPFSFSFINESNASAAGIDFSVELGMEASFFTIEPEEFIIGSIIIDADAGFLGVPINSQVGFTDCVPLANGFRVFGFSLSPDGVLHPGNVGIPVVVQPPFPQPQQLAFKFDVSSPVEAEPPIIRVSVNPSGNLELEYTGILKAADTVEGPFSDVTNATSPFEVRPDEDQKFFRTED